MTSRGINIPYDFVCRLLGNLGYVSKDSLNVAFLNLNFRAESDKTASPRYDCGCVIAGCSVVVRFRRRMVIGGERVKAHETLAAYSKG